MAIREMKEKVGTKTYDVYVTGSAPCGKRVQKLRRGIRSKREAERVEFELRRELAALRERPADYLWEEWFARCLAMMKAELKPSTLLGYTGKNKHWIEPHFRGKAIASISAQDIHYVVYDPTKSASWYTRKTVLKHIKRILMMAVHEELIATNPALRVQVRVPKAQQAVLNKSEVDTLLNSAKLLKHRFYYVWAVALLTGMRSGELYALQWPDIDRDGGKIHVVRSWSSKNGIGPTKTAENRVVPISGELGRLLSELKLSQTSTQEDVLPRLAEWRAGYQSQVLREFCEGLGITSVRFHDLRATFITRMLSQGVPVAVVMAIVGHSQLKTTQAYLRLAGIELEGATEELGFRVPSDRNGDLIQLFNTPK